MSHRANLVVPLDLENVAGNASYVITFRCRLRKEVLEDLDLSVCHAMLHQGRTLQETQKPLAVNRKERRKRGGARRRVQAAVNLLVRVIEIIG
jgi:hypothetical protein